MPHPSPLAEVRFLGFDVFGTVVDWRTGIAREAEGFLRRHGVEVDPTDFADEWRSLYQPALERVRSGEREWTRLSVLNRENLDEVLERHGVSAAWIPEDELAHLGDAWTRLDPWPDVREGLTRLKRSYAIGPLSNGDIRGMLWLSKHAGLPWDVIVGAEVAKSYKTMPESYLRSAEAVGLRPDQVALVAAHNEDLEAASALGLRTVFVRRPLEHGAGQTTDLKPSAEWDVIADSLIEVAERLER